MTFRQKPWFLGLISVAMLCLLSATMIVQASTGAAHVDCCHEHTDREPVEERTPSPGDDCDCVCHQPVSFPPFFFSSGIGAEPPYFPAPLVILAEGMPEAPSFGIDLPPKLG